MRKRIVIAGFSDEGLELLPLLEANPAVEVGAIVADDPVAALLALRRAAPDVAERLGVRISNDVAAALAMPGLVAVVDADAPDAIRERLPPPGRAPGRGTAAAGAARDPRLVRPHAGSPRAAAVGAADRGHRDGCRSGLAHAVGRRAARAA